jgi:hypothetical protein
MYKYTCFGTIGRRLTPVRTTDHGCVINTRSSCASHSEIRELDRAVLIGKQVCALNIAVDDTLVVQVHKALEDLGDVDGDEVLREFAKSFTYGMKGSILTEPTVRG